MSSSSQIKIKEHLKHGWTLDSIEDLSENVIHLVEEYKNFNFVHLYTKCQEELQCWHAAAVAHLGQIYSQRLADLNQIYSQDVYPESEKFKDKMIDQLKTRILPRIHHILDDPIPDQNRVEKMQVIRCFIDFDLKRKRKRKKLCFSFLKNVLIYMKNECEMMLNRQWIRIQLPDIKNLSIPIKITRSTIKSHLIEHENDLFLDLNENETEENNRNNIKNDLNSNEINDLSDSTKRKRKIRSIDPIDLFLLNPEPMKSYGLDTNSSTLSLSNSHILIHDYQKLILFDYDKKLHEFSWNENTFGILVDICWMPILSSFLLLTIHSVYIYDPLKILSSSSNIPIKIDSIQPLERTQIFASITSFDRDIYINYHKGVHLDQYRLLPTSQWTLEKRYSKQNTFEIKDIGMRDCRSDGQYLSLSIMQQDDFKWRIDLMSKDLQRIRRGIPMDCGENQHKFFSMLIPLYDQRWIFLNWFTNKIWIIDQQGKIKLIKESKIKNIRNISISSNQSFIAIRTEKPNYLKLYQLD